MPPRLKKCGGHVPRVPHQIAPMFSCLLDSVVKETLRMVLSPTMLRYVEEEYELKVESVGRSYRYQR